MTRSYIHRGTTKFSAKISRNWKIPRALFLVVVCFYIHWGFFCRKAVWPGHLSCFNEIDSCFLCGNISSPVYDNIWNSILVLNMKNFFHIVLNKFACEYIHLLRTINAVSWRYFKGIVIYVTASCWNKIFNRI